MLDFFVEEGEAFNRFVGRMQVLSLNECGKTKGESMKRHKFFLMLFILSVSAASVFSQTIHEVIL
ncbi:MAG: hypothetical protein MUP70_04535, partial [Candidatus Aminicenantes bacterium]|nr:hypothetical protein [Candidatus Aminicenantes bacterium]